MCDKTELQTDASATHGLSSAESAVHERLVMLPDGWFPDGKERPLISAVVLKEQNGWARVRYENGHEETVTTKAFISAT